jgi:hypothetical protein
METHFSASLLLPKLVLVGLTKSISYDIIHLPTNQKQRSGGKRAKRVPDHYKLDFFLKKKISCAGSISNNNASADLVRTGCDYVHKQAHDFRQQIRLLSVAVISDSFPC